MDTRFKEIEQLAEIIKETEINIIEVDDTDAWVEALGYRDYRGPKECPKKKEKVVEPTVAAEKAINKLVEMLKSDFEEVASRAKFVLTKSYPEYNTMWAIKSRLQKAYIDGPRKVRKLLGEMLEYSRFRIFFDNLFRK